MLIDAIRRAKAKVVLAAADERMGLSQPQIDRQWAFLPRPGGRPAMSTWRPSAIGWCGSRPSRRPATAYPKSFAELLAEAAGYPAGRDAAAHRLAARARATAPTRSSPSRPRRCWARPTIRSPRPRATA